MQLRLNENEVRTAVAQYIEREHGVNVEPSKLNPIMVTHGQFDDTERIMEGYEIEIEPSTVLRNKLAGIEGNVTIHNGVITLEDGTQIEL